MSDNNIHSQISIDTGDAPETIGELRDQYKELLKEIGNTTEGTREYYTALAKLGETKGTLMELRRQIKELDPHQQLKTITEGVRGLAGGFAAAQGAAALLGDKNKDLAESLLKVQAAVAISTGLKELVVGYRAANVLVQSYVAKLAAQKAAEIGATEATEGATVAQGALNTIMEANPVLFVVAAIAALTAAVLIYEHSIDETAKVQEAYNKVVEKSGDGVADANIKVQKMSELFTEAATSVKLKESALVEYNKEFGDTLGKAKSFNQAEKSFANHSAAYIQAMSYRTQADAAYGLEKDELAKKFKLQVTQELSLWEKVKVAVVSSLGGIGQAASYTSSLLADDIDEADKNAKRYETIAQGFMKLANSVKGVNLYGKDDDNAERKAEELLEKYQAAVVEFNNFLKQQSESDPGSLHRAEEQLQEHYDKLVEIAKTTKQPYIHETEEMENARLALIRNVNARILGEQKLAGLEDADEQQKESAQTIKIRKGLDDAITASFKNANQQRLDAIKTDFLAQEAALNSNYAKGLITAQTYNNKMLKLKIEELKQEIEAEKTAGKDSLQSQAALEKAEQELSKQTAAAKKADIAAVGNALANASQLFGKATAAGKALSIASATVKTYESAVSSYNSLASIPVVGPELGFVAAAAAVAAGIANVKKIAAVKVPGGHDSGGGSTDSGGGSSGVSSGRAPDLGSGSSGITTLSNSSVNHLSNTLNRQNQSSQRAYVVESDITASQQTASNRRQASSI